MASLHACRSLRYRDGVLLARVWLQEVPGGRGIRLGAQTPEENVGAWKCSTSLLCDACEWARRQCHTRLLAAVSTIPHSQARTAEQCPP